MTEHDSVRQLFELSIIAWMNISVEGKTEGSKGFADWVDRTLANPSRRDPSLGRRTG